MINHDSHDRLNEDLLFSSALDFIVYDEPVYAIYLLKGINRKDDIVLYDMALCFYKLSLYQESYDELKQVSEKPLVNFDFNLFPALNYIDSKIGFPPMRRGIDSNLFNLSVLRLKIALCKKLGFMEEVSRLSSYIPCNSPWYV